MKLEPPNADPPIKSRNDGENSVTFAYQAATGEQVVITFTSDESSSALAKLGGYLIANGELDPAAH